MILEHSVADAIAKGFFLSALGLTWVILLVRIVGLRSLSKMTNFDFVMTVAMGSLLAGAAQAGSWPALLQILTAMLALFVAQFCLAYARRRSETFRTVLQNAPVLLMKDGKMLHAALRATRVTEGDLIAKLREANALDPSAVRAVVLETTGDVSVMHGGQIDDSLLRDIRRHEER